MSATHHEIVVIGGGAVGVACALRLRQDGHQVVLLDPEDIASQCSYGNASTLAEYACTPIANASVWANLPRLLFSQDSPFVVRWSRLPELAPWLLRFMRQCTASNALGNAQKLARLLAQTYAGYEPLLEQAPQARALIRSEGCLYAYGTQEALRGAQADIRLRRSLGIEQEELDAAGIAALEPVMAGQSVGLVEKVEPVADILAALVAEAEAHLAKWRRVTDSEPKGEIA